MHDENSNEKLIERYQQGEDKLANTIVENNLGLIHLVLKRFRWAYNNHPKYDDIISYEDLFQEGVLGVYDAIRKYDCSQGAFSTYAVIHIRQKVFRFMYDKGRVIRVPQEPQRTMKRVRDTETLLAQKLQREPTEREIAKQAGISLKDLQELKQVFGSVASIDAPIGEDEDLKLSDIIEDKTDYLDGIERTAVLKSLRKDLESMARVVIKDEIEIKILFSYFDRIGKKQVKDIAADYNISTGKLQRVINDSIGRIAARFLDELIEKYSDLFSSSIRRTREKDLFQARQSRSIQRVASSLIKPGDSLTIISSLGTDGLKTSTQAAVKMISEDWLSISYVGYEYLKGEYMEKGKTIYYSDIIDFRTENKKIVEIACVRLML
jgi:RNA polymerase primary sigma factor